MAEWERILAGVDSDAQLIDALMFFGKYSSDGNLMQGLAFHLSSGLN